MFFLFSLLIALFTYFILKPLFTLAPATPQNKYSSQRTFEQAQEQFKNYVRQDQRPKHGFQGGEYIDFEELE